MNKQNKPLDIHCQIIMRHGRKFQTSFITEIKKRVAILMSAPTVVA